MDYWGFYNGAENISSLTGYRHTLIPSIEGLGINQNALIIQGQGTLKTKESRSSR